MGHVGGEGTQPWVMTVMEKRVSDGDRLPHLDGCGMQTSGLSLRSGIEVSLYRLYLGCLLLGNWHFQDISVLGESKATALLLSKTPGE